MQEIVGRLEAETAVSRTVIVMNRAFDAEDWKMVRDCLSEDIQLGENNPPVKGAEAIRGPDKMIDAMKSNIAKLNASGKKYAHVIGDMVIDIDGNNASASAFQYTYIYRGKQISSPVSKAGSSAIYQLRKESGVWRITAFRIQRLWLEGEPY